MRTRAQSIVVLITFQVVISLTITVAAEDLGGAFRGAHDGAFPVLKPGGTDKWRVHIWYIKDGRFENRANGSDFRFSSHGKGPIWINRVWFSLVEPPDDFDPEGIFGIAKPVEWHKKLAIAWGQLKFKP